jgi:hypothetical protein
MARISNSTRELSWRLVHDGVNIIAFFEAEGVTSTINQLFTGTEDECLDEIVRLGLVEPSETPE